MEANNLFKSFVIWALTALLIIFLYNTYLNYKNSGKIDQISSIIRNSCELPYGLQDKIEQTYEILNSSTCTNGN